MSEEIPAEVSPTVAADSPRCQIALAPLALNPSLMDDKSVAPMSMLLVKDLGAVEFSAALDIQERLVSLKQRGLANDLLLFVEHPHVYTLGRGGKAINVLEPGDVPVHRTSRGGDVTYHGPGQLVVYPILDLRSKLRKDVHRYVRNLEQSAIQTLADFGIATTRRPPHTGIWIEDRKIAAIGVAVRRAITYHGLALNVNTDLSFFQRIVPCGLAWAAVTSMEQELMGAQDMERVKERFLHHFADIFGYTRMADADRQSKTDDRHLPLSIFHSPLI